MGRWLQRGLMVVIGLSVFLVYAVAAYLGYRLVVGVWVDRVRPLELLLTVGLAAVLLGYLSYRLGTARLLATVRARPLPRERAPGIHRRLEGLVSRMDVDKPELRVGRLPGPNALSLGSARSGVLILDADLLRLLDLDELEGILAHELAHLERYDVLLRTLAVTAAQTVVGLLFILLLPVILLATGLSRGYAWIAGRPGRKSGRGFTRFNRVVLVLTAGLLFVLTLSVRAFSRRREFAADDRAARVTGRPEALARALQKVERASEGPAGLLSHLYVSGDDDTEEGLQRLLSTHPPMDERVERLERLAREQAAQRWTTIPVK